MGEGGSEAKALPHPVQLWPKHVLTPDRHSVLQLPGKALGMRGDERRAGPAEKVLTAPSWEWMAPAQPRNTDSQSFEPCKPSL